MSNILKANTVVFMPGDTIPIINANRDDSKKDIEVLSDSKDDSLYEKKMLEINVLLKNCQEESQRIIQQARTEAKQTLDKAIRDAEEAKLSAIEEGKAKGYTEGISQTESLKLKIEEDTQKVKEKVILETESQLVELMSEIIKKFLSNAARVNPEVLLFLIKAGLSNVNFNGANLNEEIIIRVSMEDYEMASSHLLEILPSPDANVKIVSDAALSSMDCVIETSIGSVDSSLNKQYKLLQEDLYQILNASEKGSSA